jgi:hypothetical protein
VHPLIREPESLSQSHVFLGAVCVSRGAFLSCGHFHYQVEFCYSVSRVTGRYLKVHEVSFNHSR